MRRALVISAMLLGTARFDLAATPATSPATNEAVSARELGLHAGDALVSVLATLNARGYHIVYSDALVLPTMTLRAAPVATNIGDLLREILTPWKLRARRASNGDWLITAATVDPPAANPAIAASDENIESIDVTASRLRIAVNGSSESFLDRRDVENMPHLADDAMRMLKVMPGVAGGDISAAFNIRGGRRDEALLTIDGAEIHNAFHFRDIDGAFSVFDTHMIEGIDFVTGGMTADIGDYMSGVVALQTRHPSPDDEYRNGLGVSFVSAYGHSSGNFADDRGSWLVSVRRGFLDFLTQQVMSGKDQLTPRYTDLYAATNYQAGERTSIGLHTLLSDDDLRLLTSGDNDSTDSAGGGRSAHVWLTLDHGFTDTLQSRTLLEAAFLKQTRDASGFDDRRSGTVRADDNFHFLDFKSDWSWRLGDRHLPRWGVALSSQRGSYDYSLVSSIYDPIITPVPIPRDYASDLSVSLRKTGVYAAWRERLSDQFTVEAGGRHDQYRYEHGLEFSATSPRFNAVYTLDGNNEVRAAWGIVWQPQAVNDLQVEDNVTTFFGPERVRYAELGYSRQFASALSLRVDLYDKRYSDLRPSFENGLDPVQLIPEGAFDRVRIDAPVARARGLEVTVRKQAERGISGWASVSIARTEEREAGRWVARSWDQPVALSFGGNWTGSHWTFGLAGLLHGGTPVTSFDYTDDGIAAQRNADRFGAYARLDFRASRAVEVRTGSLSFYLEVTNLLDRQNECCIDSDSLEVRQGMLVTKKSYGLPLLPSLGLQWDF